MVLTLFVLPVLYWLFFRNEEEAKDENNDDELKTINS
jgi:hypothetical protein